MRGVNSCSVDFNFYYPRKKMGSVVWLNPEPFRIVKWKKQLPTLWRFGCLPTKLESIRLEWIRFVYYYNDREFEIWKEVLNPYQFLHDKWLIPYGPELNPSRFGINEKLENDFTSNWLKVFPNSQIFWTKLALLCMATEQNQATALNLFISKINHFPGGQFLVELGLNQIFQDWFATIHHESEENVTCLKENNLKWNAAEQFWKPKFQEIGLSNYIFFEITLAGVFNLIQAGKSEMIEEYFWLKEGASVHSDIWKRVFKFCSFG